MGLGEGSTQYVITLNQPSIAHGLAPAALGTSEKGPSRHGFEAGACRVSDVLATITADADGDDALDIPLLIAHRVDVENVEKTCVWHGRVPRSQLHAAGWDE